MDSWFEKSSDIVLSEAKKLTAFMKDVKEHNLLFKIKLAPLHVPTNRRLQTAAALFWISWPLMFGPALWLTLLYFSFYSHVLRLCIAVYFVWMFIDSDTCEQGGRRSQWYRSLNIWNYYRDFFPVQLIKTVDLPPDRNYLFAVYPHGILASGAFAAFLTESLKFGEVFKSLKTYTATLKLNFSLPILREIAFAHGLVAASKKSLNWVLGSPGVGRVAVLVVGGAAEALNNKPGVYKIVLKNRKGFCKVALQNGSPLVPVFTFGEIDLYEQVIFEEDSLLDHLQHWVKKVTGIAPVVFFGRGIFNYTIGLLPRRVPLYVVVGKPIDVIKNESPTDEQINTLHQQFKDSILQLFNQEKHKYLEDPNTELIID